MKGSRRFDLEFERDVAPTAVLKSLLSLLGDLFSYATVIFIYEMALSGIGGTVRN